MTHQPKWNKELLYSAILLISANILLVYGVLDTILNYLLSKGFIYTGLLLLNAVMFVFLASSAYIGLKSTQKSAVSKERRILRNIPWALAFLMVFISVLEIITLAILELYHYSVI
jgi:hypothetical protein